ncbi:20866_t:CDS:2, partial [Rhizophagus irregularis]
LKEKQNQNEDYYLSKQNENPETSHEKINKNIKRNNEEVTGDDPFINNYTDELKRGSEIMEGRREGTRVRRGEMIKVRR